MAFCTNHDVACFCHVSPNWFDHASYVHKLPLKAQFISRSRETVLFPFTWPYIRQNTAKYHGKQGVLFQRSPLLLLVLARLPGRIKCTMNVSVNIMHWRLCMFHTGLVSCHLPQVNESDGDDQCFGEYALDFMAGEKKNQKTISMASVVAVVIQKYWLIHCLSPSESPGMLESSLSPVGLISFQGCIIPPLTPQQDIPPQDSPMAPPEPGEQHAQDTAPWRGTAEDKHWLLDNSTRVNQRVNSVYDNTCFGYWSFAR